MRSRQKLVYRLLLISRKGTFVGIEADGRSKKMKLQPLPSFLEMTIEKMPDRPILSLVHPRPVISPSIEVRKETKITVKTLDQVAKMVEPPPLASTQLKSKKKINNPRSDRILARSSAITVKKWVTMPISVPTKS